MKRGSPVLNRFAFKRVSIVFQGAPRSGAGCSSSALNYLSAPTLILAIVSSLVLLPAVSHSLEPVLVDARFEQLEQQLEVQLERVRYAREMADRTMSLARITAAERLRSSEQQLMKERATLERLREQLREQTTEATAPSGGEKDWPALLANALSGIEAKIREVVSLLDRLESFRGDMDAEDDDFCAERLLMGQLNSPMPRPEEQSHTATQPSSAPAVSLSSQLPSPPPRLTFP